jgi:transcription factor SPN1
MMQRRKEAMARARRRRRRDIDITAVDDHIMAMIREMRQAAEEDRQLNQARQPALKKLKMLPTVMVNLKKSDLQTSFIECGILTVLAEWLSPLPDHSLPHVKIRESILDILKSYPVPESHILKSSRIGKAVMLLYRHPKETRKNKEKAGKIINEWARPIFGLASDFKSLGRDEREERDYANLSQATKRRLSSSSDPSKKTSQEEEYEPAKPGDKGWISRARVPMPSTRDYVVRPKWKAEQEFKRGPSKKVMNRYEKQINKEKQRKMRGKTSHAISISVEGRKMPL